MSQAAPPPPACKKGEIRSCFTAQQGCTRDGLGFACKGNCQAGISHCDDKGNWGECTNQIGPQQEQCDHQDNDCDGIVDEGCTCQPNTTQYCFPSALRFRNKGICRDGLQQCVKGIWGDCVGSTTPQTEVCDFQDNNCDGAVDDGCNCTTGQERTCYAGAAAKRNIGECRDGNQICQRGVWGACTQSVLPTLEECDGKDNDCDGQVDENLTAPLCDNQKGVCKGARKSCGGAAGWTACDDTLFAAHDPAYVAGDKEDKSHCDGKDNDCDGQIDETCPAAACQAGATRPCYTGDPSTKGVGECKDGLQFCFQNQWSQRCYSEITPSVERCGDNKDNDCNGLIDETCEATKEAIADAGPEMPVELPPEAQCVPGTKRTCPYYAGGKIYAGIGICSVGTQTCAANAKWEATCTGQVLPQAGEDCNGKDDNCNGIIDEPFLLTAPTTQCSKTKGACQGIKPRCVNGAWETTCDYAAYTTLYQAQETLCDGIDNDCNGTIDESCPWAQLFGGKLYAATVDTKGTIYVVGYFDDSTNIPNCTSRYFGTSTIPKASTFQLFVASVTPSGQAQLLQTFTTGLPNQEDNAARIHKMSIDSAGNIYLAGDFKKELKLGSYTLRTGEYPKGDNWNGFLAKLDNKGIVQWATPLQSQTSTHTHDLALHTDTQGKTFATVVGMVSGVTVLFHTPPTTLNPTVTSKDVVFQSSSQIGIRFQYKAYIARLDTNGILQWAKSIGDFNSSAQLRAVAVDAAGNAFVAGNAYTNLTWNGKTYTALSGAVYWHFVAQFTNSGQYGWLLQGGGGLEANILPDQGRSHLALRTKAKGEVEIYYTSFSPNFKGTFGSLTLPLSYGRERIVVTQVIQPASGSTTCGSQPACWNWIKVIDTPGIDKPSGLAIDTKGDIYLSGALSTGTVINKAILVSFGSIQRRVSTGDSFVARLASSGTFQDVATAGGITAMKPTGVAFLPGSQKIYALGNLDQAGQQPLVSFHNRSAQAPLCQRWSYLWELNVAKLTP